MSLTLALVSLALVLYKGFSFLVSLFEKTLNLETLADADSKPSNPTIPPCISVSNYFFLTTFIFIFLWILTGRCRYRCGGSSGRQPKKRTFKKFSFRGVDLDALLDMSTDELVKLFTARARRRYVRYLYLCMLVFWKTNES